MTETEHPATPEEISDLFAEYAASHPASSEAKPVRPGPDASFEQLAAYVDAVRAREASVATGVGPHTSIAQARTWVMSNRQSGVRCPCCDQLVKEYLRPINAGQARSMILMHRLTQSGQSQDGWIHLPTQIPARSREEGKLAHHGLLEEKTERDTNGNKQGYWRLTPKGVQFVLGQIQVPRYARLYDNELIRIEGDPININDALGTKFSFDELMRGDLAQLVAKGK